MLNSNIYNEMLFQGRLWTPQILAVQGRLTRWWDMNDLSTISIAASVLSVKDKVAGTTVALGGAGNTLTALTSKSGRGILCGQGGSSKGTFTATGTGDHTFYFCSEPNTSTLLTPIMAAAGGTGFTALGFGWEDTAPVGLYLVSNSGGSLRGTTKVVAGTPAVGSARTLSGNSQLWLNGKLDGTDTTAGANSVGISRLMDDDNVDQYQGIAYEWMYWVGRHSDDEMRKIEGYLAWKWNVQSRLTSTHPYRNRPPSIGG